MNKHTCKAKRLSTTEWLYGFYYYHECKEGPKHWIVHFENGIKRCSAVDPNTVCRYTGLNDKNGVDIFEEDILKLGLFTFKVIWLYDKYICMGSIDGITKYELGYVLQHKEATFDSNKFD